MKKALKITFSVITWVFVAFAVLVTILAFSAQKNKDGVPNVFNKIPITVISDSMKPTFKAGDLIIDNSLSAEEKKSLKVDEIITFYSDLNGDGEDEINTHRIVSVSDQDGYIFYTTRGDNTETNTKNDDKLVRYDMVIGKYNNTKVGGIGSILSFLRTANGFLLVIVLPLIIFFLYELYHFIIAVVVAKNKNPITDEQESYIKQKAVEEYIKQQQEQSSESTKEEVTTEKQ